MSLTIGELAATAHVGVETIRFYEREGLIPEPRRSASGYRQYDDADVWRLSFIRRAKDLGFTLRDIAELLGPGAARSVADVERLARHRLTAIDEELVELRRRRDGLAELLVTCTDGDAVDCVQLDP